MKLKAGAPQDMADAAKLVEHTRAKLDRAYLRHWGKSLGIEKWLRGEGF